MRAMDSGVGERLRQATETVNPPDDPVERLQRRRNRKRRNERLSATVVSLVLVGALVGGSVAVVHGMHRGTGVTNPVAMTSNWQRHPRTTPKVWQAVCESCAVGQPFGGRGGPTNSCW